MITEIYIKGYNTASECPLVNKFTQRELIGWIKKRTRTIIRNHPNNSDFELGYLASLLDLLE